LPYYFARFVIGFNDIVDSDRERHQQQPAAGSPQLVGQSHNAFIRSA